MGFDYLKRYHECIEEIGTRLLKELPEDTKKALAAMENESDLVKLHFGLGMYIRNKYVYGYCNRMEADSVSSGALRFVWAELRKDQDAKQGG